MGYRLLMKCAAESGRRLLPMRSRKACGDRGLHRFDRHQSKVKIRPKLMLKPTNGHAEFSEMR